MYGGPTIDYFDLPKTMEPEVFTLYKSIREADAKQLEKSLNYVSQSKRMGLIRDDKDQTILHAIGADSKITDVYEKTLCIVNSLLADGSLFTVLNTNHRKQTPLQMEARNGRNILLNILTTHPALQSPDDLEKLKNLLQKPDSRSRSMVDYAIIHYNRDYLETIKKLGIPLKTKEITPLLTACGYIKDRTSRADCIQYLLEDPDIKAQIDARTTLGGYTALHNTVRKRDPISTKILIAHNANHYVPNYRNQNAYQYAKKRKENNNDKSLDEVIAELKNPHDIAARNVFSAIGTITPTTRFSDIEGHLFYRGCRVPIDIRDEKDGTTLLMKAAQRGNNALLIDLNQQGAERSKKSNAGYTACYYAPTKTTALIVDTGILGRFGLFTNPVIRRAQTSLTQIKRTLGFSTSTS